MKRVFRRIRNRTSLAILLAAGLVADGSAASRTLRFEDFFGQLVDLDRLPYLEEGIRCAQFSSYDRKSRIDPETGEKIDWGANGDRGHYLEVDPETGEALMADIRGPGCIYRIWSANPQGRIRFYLDGDTEPTYEFDFKDLFTGAIPPFDYPVVWARGEGGKASCSYFPIPFARSCRVTADQAYGSQYYHIGYQTFPEDWEVETFHLPLDEAEREALDRAREILLNPGTDPQPEGRRRIRRGTIDLEPGRETRFFADRGPGVVTSFFVKVEAGERPDRRTLWLRVHYDRQTVPSVAAPLGDFFGAAFAPGPYASLPMSMGPDGFRSFWRMPFHRSVEFFLRNDGSKPARVSWEIAVRPERELPVGTAYFCAKWWREPEGGHFDYPFLVCRGRGRFVGAALFVDNVRGGWWGEGDEKFTVDGEPFPSTFGTGSEDYFGDAWGIRYFVNPYHGCPVTVGRAQSCYRWHITDFVPFTESFEATIENYAWQGDDPNDYASMAYWYQIGPPSDFFMGNALIDRTIRPLRMEKGVVEAESMFDANEPPSGIGIVDDSDAPELLSRGKAVRMEGAPGTRFPCVMKVPAADRYELEIGFVRGYEGTARFSAGKPAPGSTVFLTAGDNPAEFELVGPAKTGETVVSLVDFVRIQPFKNWIRRWRIIGPFDNTDDLGRAAAYPPEKEIDFAASYEGKDGKTVSWGDHEADFAGLVSLEALYGGIDHAVAYAYTNITAPRDMEADLLLGSDDGVKVWLNGEVVHVNQVRRPIREDQDRVRLALRKGSNPLLIKVDEGVGDWGFKARIVDPEGVLIVDPDAPTGGERE